MTYRPEAGDVVWIDFDPRVERDQSGRRPALVVSPAAFWEASGFVIVCPVTSQVRTLGTSVMLPAGLEVLASHVRSIDTAAQPIAFAGASVPRDILADVRAKLAALIGL